MCGFPFMPLPWGLQMLGEALEMSEGLWSWKPSFHHEEKIYFITGEGNGSPLQYSCLENPVDRGAWRDAVYGVARVGHDLVTKPPPALPDNRTNSEKSRAKKWRMRLRTIDMINISGFWRSPQKHLVPWHDKFLLCVQVEFSVFGIKWHDSYEIPLEFWFRKMKCFHIYS